MSCEECQELRSKLERLELAALSVLRRALAGPDGDNGPTLEQQTELARCLAHHFKKPEGGDSERVGYWGAKPDAVE